MVAASFHAGEVEAQNALNRQVARAQNTSMFNYNRISGISQDTANAYIANGIIKAAETSMNYGCETPTLSAEAVATYVVTVQNAKTTANQKIANIKQNKQAQYRDYMEYQRELQRQREAAAAEEVRRKMQKALAAVSSGLAGVTKTLETLNGVRTSNGGPVETSRTDDFVDTIDCVPDLFGDVWGALGDIGEAAVEVVTILPGEVYQAALDVHQVTVDNEETIEHFQQGMFIVTVGLAFAPEATGIGLMSIPLTVVDTTLSTVSGDLIGTILNIDTLAGDLFNYDVMDRLGFPINEKLKEFMKGVYQVSQWVM